MESAVKQRLVQFIKSMHMTQRAFEIRCGMSNGYVANIRKGIGEDYLLNIAQQFPQLNRAWLLFGEGEMLKSSPSVQQNNVHGNNNYIGGNQLNRCPECGNIPALKTGDISDVYPVAPSDIVYAPDMKVSNWMIKHKEFVKKIKLSEIIGKVDWAQFIEKRAMEPHIAEGTLLFMRRLEYWDCALFDGSVYGIDMARPHMIIRRLFDDGDYIRCEPYNPEYGAVRVPKDKIYDVYEIVAKFDVKDKGRFRFWLEGCE